MTWTWTGKFADLVCSWRMTVMGLGAWVRALRKASCKWTGERMDRVERKEVERKERDGEGDRRV